MTGCLMIFSGGSNALRRNPDWDALERRLNVAAGISIAVLFLFLLLGCSPTQQIATTSTRISQTAASSKERFTLIATEATAQNPDIGMIGVQAEEGIREQEEIILLTGRIHKALPGVEDQVPYWVNVLQYGALALIILGVAWILWNTGLGTLIKRLIGFIPAPKRQDASLIRQAMDPQSPVTLREYVAARRASDPEFDRAYDRSRTERNPSIRQDAGPHARV